MKNIFKILFLVFPIFVFSQIDYGFKVGVNLNNSSSISVVSQAFENKVNKSDFQGYYIGSYISFNAIIFDLRTEFQYSTTQIGDYLAQQKIELPITVGYKIIPFLSAFAGPSFQYILNEKSNSFDLDEVSGKTTIGLNIGTRIHLGKLQLELRYERGLSSLETKLLQKQSNINVGNLDRRASLLSLGVSYKIN